MRVAYPPQTSLEATPMAVGRHVYGVGIMAIGSLSLAWGDFVNGQSVPATFPDRPVLAYVAGAFMLVAGAFMLWRRTSAWSAPAVVAYFAVIVVMLMNGAELIAQYKVYGEYENLAIEFAIALGAGIVFAANAAIDAGLAPRLMRICQVIFGLCALVFGGAHFAYMNLTAPLVPKWLPPSQDFWAYATGMGQILAGLAILTGIRSRLAAMLLTAMYASFQFLVHVPMLLADPSNHYIWGENAENIVLTGVAWLVAETLPRPSR